MRENESPSMIAMVVRGELDRNGKSLAAGYHQSGVAYPWFTPRCHSWTRLARISHTFRREAQREPCSHKEDAAFPAGLCVNTLPEEKSKSDAVDAGLPQAAADKCEKCGLGKVAAPPPPLSPEEKW
jgi:hypothetical protein